jgi:hypothetical protein
MAAALAAAAGPDEPGEPDEPEELEEPDEPAQPDDLDVDAVLEAGAQSSADPGETSGGLDENLLFTESVVIPLSAVTGARAISLETSSSAERLAPNELTGPRQAVVQLVSGMTRSGLVSDPDLCSGRLVLEPSHGSQEKAREIPFEQIRAVQLMLPRGLARPLPVGPKLRVLLDDGKALVGFSPDHAPGCQAFTLFPVKDKFIERVIVIARAAREVMAED